MACLFAKDVEFQLIRVDSFRGPKRLERPKLHPHGDESVIFDDGLVTLVDSREILLHIGSADKYKNQGNKELFGPGAVERFVIKQWVEVEKNNFSVACADMVYSLSYLPPDMPLDGGAPAHRQHSERMEEMLQLYDKSAKELRKLLSIYDQKLYEEETEYLVDDKLSLADLAHLHDLDSIASDPRSASIMASHVKVNRWWEKISGRPSWKKVKDLQRPWSAEAPPL
ncbi:hypothetical protein PR202_gb07353 [Eleusine coracana subsp. coracana]|uniref:glutathione transferase n=1 Tax=Eleusine coracana subsp. coracana TaxID=191504 RepID=A0AAV5EBM3_ELECO|nr:hypothetical protein QOZ80_2BG0169190 [Eleusine coracana subsp. coracana]GJN20030.1 hypothetical protein PR202_gb07353 [Eleusine coracana subsp. coracana]